MATSEFMAAVEAQELKRTSYNRTLMGDDMDSVAFDFDVYLPTKGRNLQRPYVWTLAQQEALILSMLKGIEIPRVSVITTNEKDEQGRGILQVIDGKQRLMTFKRFIENEFSVDFSPLVPDAGRMYFKDLPRDAQYELLVKPKINANTVNDGRNPLTDDEKIRWFLNLNFGGTPQEEGYQNELRELI